MTKYRKSPVKNPNKRRKVDGPAQKQEEKPRLGRPPLPEGERKTYFRHPVSLTEEQMRNLLDLAEALGIKSRSGPNRGLPGWRTMIAILADKAPEIIAQKKKNPTAFRPVLIFPGVSLILHPEAPNPNRIDESGEEAS